MKRIIVITFLVFKTLIDISQSNPSYTVFSGFSQGTALTGSSGAVITFSNTSKVNSTSPATPILRERNRSAKLYMSLDLGNDYIKSTNNWNFKVDAEITYKFGTATAITKTLSINQGTPEQLIIDDVMASFTSTSPAFNATVAVLNISNGSTPTVAVSGLLNNFINNNLRFTVQLAREYDVDVRYAANGTMTSPLTITSPTLINRRASFNWQPSIGVLDNYPNYQIQILKLYNTNPNLQTNNTWIGAKPDWSQALTVETQSFRNAISLTIGEGSGFYFWRARPIGTYYDGAIGNSENYGDWSYTDTNMVSLQKNGLLSASNPLPYAFYVTDPDENLNWIYNRIFTEGDAYDKSNPTGVKASEGISYSNGLQQLKQNQKLNSEDNTSIISQTIQDYSGRPALNTLPVPVAGGLTNYKNNFVTTPLSQLYTAAGFDSDASLQSIGVVNDGTTSAFAYYSGNSTAGINNTNVANAEGYDFNRTLFKNDGSGRVGEESTPGKTHSIGLRSNGQGHTTKTFYGTPSDDELIHIFGNEAPMSESVIKTVTIDQNDVVSVSYTSKEGKTIATALSSTATANLSALDGTLSALTITNSVDQNVITNGKVIASKRIFITDDNTTINMAYSMANMPGANTDCIGSGCNFLLRFYLTDLKNNITYVSDADATAGISSFTTSSGTTFTFPVSWKFVNVITNSLTLNPTGTANNQLTLNNGEYIFTKELFSNNGDNYADSLVDLENDKTRLIFDALAEKMQAVNNATTQADFLSWFNNFRSVLTGYQSSHDAAVSAALWYSLGISPTPTVSFPLPPDFDLAPMAPSGDHVSSGMQVSTKCCGTMGVLIPNPGICVSCDGISTSTASSGLNITQMSAINHTVSLDSITPFGLKDFEADPSWASLSVSAKRTALFDLIDREYITPLKSQMADAVISTTDLWKIAPGFSFESLNFMIANMLISRYYTGSVIYDNTNWYECSKDMSGNYVAGNIVGSSTYTHNYDCKKIFEAWTGAVELINSFEIDPGDNNVIQAFDDSQGPLATVNQLLNVDSWAPELKTAIQLLDGAITRIINRFKHSRSGNVSSDRLYAATCLPANFVNFAGYQFAAIVDGSKLPAFTSSASTNVPDDYFDFQTPAPPGASTIYGTVTLGTTSSITHSYVPYLYDQSSALLTYSCNGIAYRELYYPYTLKPEWMFKYFVYNVYNNTFIDDASPLIPHQLTIDLQQKYNEPFSYLSSPSITAAQLCQTPPASVYTLGAVTSTVIYTHKNWSAGEREIFYKQIIGGAACPQEKGVDSPGSATGGTYYDSDVQPACETKMQLITEAKSLLDQAMNNCQQKAPAVKAALIDELTAACYTLVPCKSTPFNAGEVTSSEIDQMVSVVINSCVAQIQDIKNNYPSSSTVTAPACTLPSLMTQTYSASSLCDLPACSQEDCYEIIYYNDNTLGLKNNRKIHVTYFNTCDNNLLFMLDNGVFIPDIPKLTGCIKPDKIWKNCSETTCGTYYGEKTSCPSPDFYKYSKKYDVTATGTN